MSSQDLPIESDVEPGLLETMNARDCRKLA